MSGSQKLLKGSPMEGLVEGFISCVHWGQNLVLWNRKQRCPCPREFLMRFDNLIKSCKLMYVNYIDKSAAPWCLVKNRIEAQSIPATFIADHYCSEVMVSRYWNGFLQAGGIKREFGWFQMIPHESGLDRCRSEWTLLASLSCPGQEPVKKVLKLAIAKSAVKCRKMLKHQEKQIQRSS